MRLELRIGVFDFNGWSADQPIGKAKYVFENVLELEEHTPTGPIVMNICKPELTKDIVAGHSNAGVYIGTFLLLAVLVIGGVVLFFCLREKVGENPADENPVAETTNGTPSEDRREKTEVNAEEVSASDKVVAETE